MQIKHSCKVECTLRIFWNMYCSQNELPHMHFSQPVAGKTPNSNTLKCFISIFIQERSLSAQWKIHLLNLSLGHFCCPAKGFTFNLIRAQYFPPKRLQFCHKTSSKLWVWRNIGLFEKWFPLVCFNSKKIYHAVYFSIILKKYSSGTWVWKTFHCVAYAVSRVFWMFDRALGVLGGCGLEKKQKT